MDNADHHRRSLRVVSHTEDRPEMLSGFLIPDSYGIRPKEKRSFLPKSVTKRSRFAFVRSTFILHRQRIIFGGLTAVFAFLLLGSVAQLATYGLSTMAAPIIVVTSEQLPEPVPLHYGVQPALNEQSFFADARTSFIADQLTFMSVDLEAYRLQFFVDGKEVLATDIVGQGEVGSWWETPAGLYQVNDKKERSYSAFGDMYQPWLITFGGNFQIHGWPQKADGTPVAEGYAGGGIRLSDEAAQTLYELIPNDIPVLVHTVPHEYDDFVYEPKAPNITAEHYLVADIESNTILAASDLDAVVPIASITKLMTALVAAEQIDLDTDVHLSQEKYVTTLIPRLNGRWQASMYSLLQLLLVESSNEAAEVIATRVGRDRFIELMNEKAIALGLTDTAFADPSGLDDGNVSTVEDLMRLVQFIYHNRSFILELTYNQDLPTAHRGGEFGELNNFNVIDDVDSFIGGKVGETLAAGQTSVSLHKLDINGTERTLVFVVLGSKGRNADVAALEAYVKEQFVR